MEQVGIAGDMGEERRLAFMSVNHVTDGETKGNGQVKARRQRGKKRKHYSKHETHTHK